MPTKSRKGQSRRNVRIIVDEFIVIEADEIVTQASGQRPARLPAGENRRQPTPDRSALVRWPVASKAELAGNAAKPRAPLPTPQRGVAPRAIRRVRNPTCRVFGRASGPQALRQCEINSYPVIVLQVKGSAISHGKRRPSMREITFTCQSQPSVHTAAGAAQQMATAVNPPAEYAKKNGSACEPKPNTPIRVYLALPPGAK